MSTGIQGVADVTPARRKRVGGSSPWMCLAAVLVIASFASAAATANAARTGTSDGAVRFYADPGEMNDVAIAVSGVHSPAVYDMCERPIDPPCLILRDRWEVALAERNAPLTHSCTLGSGAPGVDVCGVWQSSLGVVVRLEDGDDRAVVRVPPFHEIQRALVGDSPLREPRHEIEMYGHLYGGSGDDSLTVEGSGVWRIDGGRGADRITGSTADDTIMVRDGDPDAVHCGEGVDTVDADSSDVTEGCESVTVGEPDRVAPESRAGNPSNVLRPDIVVPFSAFDPEPSSGLANVELWVRSPGETAFALVASRDATGNTLGHYARSDGEHQAYTIATDREGNREAAPATPDVTYTVNRYAPEVTATNPVNGATGVATSARASVTFSEPMDRAATERAFSLTDAAGRAVQGAFAWDGTTMTFTPKRLARATRYRAAIAATARDAGGRPPDAATTWSFTTS